jgi:hypothetical protein
VPIIKSAGVLSAQKSSTGAVFGGPLTAAVFSPAETAPIGFLQVD